MTTGAVGLEQFEHTAHQNGHQEGPEEQLLVIETGVTAQVLDPDDAARAAIHHQVGPLVDKRHIVERRLREDGGQRQNPDKDDTADRKWVLSKCGMRNEE